MNKKETIENIKDINSLVQVVISLCEKVGLKEIVRISENILSAIEIGALKEKSHIFIVTLSELSGKVPQILENVKNYSKNNPEITIITNHNKPVSSYFIKWIKEEAKYNKFDFWSQAEMISKIDAHIPHFWGHNDLFLKAYEDAFIKNLESEVELKKILKLDKKFESLLNIFVEPKIYIFKEDKETQRTTRIKISFERLLKKENYFITGDAGTGKSTLLKQLGKKIIEVNHQKAEKALPLIIKPSDLQDANFSIKDAVELGLKKNFGIQDLTKIFNDYHLVLLLDSIDEFEKSIKESIINDLDIFLENCSCNFIISTRNYENLIEGLNPSPHFKIFLSNFDQRQVKQYLDNFFKFDLSKSNQLWENLMENHILDRIPVTPLTISLVSILYEEKQYEVPATLTDVFDNFNQFLLGRTTVKTNLEFLDINIKERVLSIYALEIIRTTNRKRKTTEEFISSVKAFFKEKSITVNEELVPELLNSLTDGTGILYLDEKGAISFKHDHFMEYYASREMFIQHNRIDFEKELIDNFTEYNWQNTAIFYTGRTKDMPVFLTNLIKRVNEYSNLNDCLLAISGLGYVLQSLWLTDSKIRKDGVVIALELLLKADSRVKQLAEEKSNFFHGIREIDLAFMNLVWFFNHFNSIAIKDPLNLAFEHLYEQLQLLNGTVFDHDKSSKLYQLFCIASTLSTGRNSDINKLNVLFNEQSILNNPFFVILFDEGAKVLEIVGEQKLKEDNKIKNKFHRYSSAIKFYLDTPAEDLRFTNHYKLAPIKKFELITEGKTDASIIYHAFSILTNFQEPYWNISSMDKVKNVGGGANELRKHLEELGRTIQ
ncbi:MAG: NACHT domain-containing protein, partial [Bacteroidia bacterium]|nr:NACHT domain-containing protein [Bacteroidia bacterium]